MSHGCVAFVASVRVRNSKPASSDACSSYHSNSNGWSRPWEIAFKWPELAKPLVLRDAADL
eukprot:3341110-Amphidinium_carterae.1